MSLYSLVPEAIDRAYLAAATPASVYDWLKTRKGQILPDETIQTLLARKEPLIDLALAQFCPDEACLRDLFRRADVGLQCAVLANHFHTAEHFFMDVLSSNPSPVVIFDADGAFQQFMREASNDLLAAYLMNPGLSPETLEAILSRRDPLKLLDDERWQLLALFTLHNPRLHEGPESDAAIAALGGRSYSEYHGAQCYAWGLFLTLPATGGVAAVLRKLAPTLSFSGFHLSKEEISGALNKAEPGDEAKALLSAGSQKVLSSLDAIFERWTPPPDVEANVAEVFGDLREAIASRVVASIRGGELGGHLGDHSDLRVRRGFYRSFRPKDRATLDRAIERDGNECLDAAVENPWFADSTAPWEIRRHLYELAEKSHWNKRGGGPSLGSRLRDTTEALVETDPSRYDSEGWMKWDPEEGTTRAEPDLRRLSQLVAGLAPDPQIRRKLEFELRRTVGALFHALKCGTQAQERSQHAGGKAQESSKDILERLSLLERSVESGKTILWILVALAAALLIKRLW